MPDQSNVDVLPSNYSPPDFNSFLSAFQSSDPNVAISQARSAGIPLGANPNPTFQTQQAATFNTSPENKDWRVKISVPTSAIPITGALAPLQQTGGAMIFPFLPTITMSHTANYQPMDIVHINYPFYAYKNSQVDEINITGKFTVQDANEGQYWLAVVHFLRTVTKMYFGQGANLGNPPPICTLNGYGDFVYNNLSVVIKSFTVTMPADVDYVSTQLTSFTPGAGSSNENFVPAISEITVVLLPVYSRDKIKSFNLTNFAQGQLIIGADGRSFI